MQCMHNNYLFTIAMFLTLPFAVLACGGAADDAEITTALSEDFGALEASDEAPFFGEQATFDELDEAADDLALDTKDVIELQVQTDLDAIDAGVEADGPAIYALAIMWGKRRFDPSATTPVVWDPTITTTCGVLGVKRLVRFENNDALLPRTSAQSVQMTSSIAPHHDGVVLALGLRSDESACAATGSITFSSPVLSEPISIDFAEGLDKVTRVEVSVGEETYQVIIGAHRVEPAAGDCVRGAVVGRYRMVGGESAEEGNNFGRFYGRVMGDFGELRGHVRGIYGTPQKGRQAGKKVFFGKLITTEGDFMGLIAGRYGRGLIGGGWHLSRDYDAVRGLLLGRYTMSDAENVDGGQFRMRYASSSCRNRVPGEGQRFFGKR